MAFMQTTDLIRAIVDVLPEPAMVISAEGRILAANSATQALFPAMRMGDLLALNLRAPDILDAMARVRAEGKTESVLWLERVPVERLFDVHIALIETPDQPHALMLALRDLTELRRVERMRVDFVANASHELRTPLASLLGFIETLQGAARDDSIARERFLKIMYEQARRMARLVDDLLSLSRIEQNLHLRPEQPVDLGLVVRHIVDTLSSMANEGKVQLKLQVAGNVMVTGDRDELLRVAENLIENAIKYGSSAKPGEQALVEIEVDAGPRQARLSVRDYGPGIASEHLPRLTERFYRVDAGESRSKGGTGLGLAIVKHIVARHRGRLTIVSKLGEGTQAEITLPVYSDD
ncbi:MAG: two-component sensor histidine kinase [Hyphomicrobiales bacterium]|nr:two-component sensor histidine kinase [Hyphomicrobiales bacterium]MDE2115932.1 two-component sensor histidine kinase [Hyphomicrobiales bacterium]